MPTNIFPRRAEHTRQAAPDWLLIGLLAFYVTAALAMVTAPYAATVLLLATSP